MIIACTSDEVRLEEPSDFRKFKVTLTDADAVKTATKRGITFVDNNNALVPVDLAPQLSDRPDDKAWRTAYARMVAQAREHSWIDAATNTIRAHVER